jgi:hypothetical protein
LAGFRYWEFLGRSASVTGLFEGLNGRQDRVRMTGHGDLEKGLADNPILVDHECRSIDTLVLSAHEALFLPDAIGFRDRMTFIGDERKRQFVLLRKSRLFPDGVRAESNYDGIDLFELRKCIAKPARLDGSARGIGLRKEEQNDITLSAEVAESNPITSRSYRCKFRCFVTNRRWRARHCRSPSHA